MRPLRRFELNVLIFIFSKGVVHDSTKKRRLSTQCFNWSCGFSQTSRADWRFSSFLNIVADASFLNYEG